MRERIEEIKRDALEEDVEESPEGTGAIDNVPLEIDIEAENKAAMERAGAGDKDDG